MKTYREILDKHIHHASREDMERLTDVTDDFVEEMRKYKPECVERFMMKLDLVLSPHFDRDTAEYFHLRDMTLSPLIGIMY